MVKASVPDQFFTVREAIKILKISDRHLRSLIASGEIKARRLGARTVRIPASEIQRLSTVA